MAGRAWTGPSELGWKSVKLCRRRRKLRMDRRKREIRAKHLAGARSKVLTSCARRPMLNHSLLATRGETSRSPHLAIPSRASALEAPDDIPVPSRNLKVLERRIDLMTIRRSSSHVAILVAQALLLAVP